MMLRSTSGSDSLMNWVVSHELTRSGAPFRRAENLVQVRDWFVHFLVKGERRMPPPPRNRAGR